MSLTRLRPIAQSEFFKGPNYTNSIIDLRENELAESDNVYVDGPLITVPGTSRVVTAAITGGSTTRVQGLFQYGQKNGTDIIMVAGSGGRLYKKAAGDSWTTISTTVPAEKYWDFAVFNDTLILTNGSTPLKYDGTTLANLTSSPATAKFVTSHGDFVLLSGIAAAPSQVRYSAIRNPLSYGTGDVLNIGVDDGQVITGQIRWGEQTLVFKEESIWSIQGETPASFSVQPTPSGLGTQSPFSIVLTDYGIFYWSEAGPTWFDGARSIPLDRKLKNILNTVNWAQRDRFVTAYDPIDRKVIFSYVRTGQTHPDRALMLDLKYGFDPADPAMWPLLFNIQATAQINDLNTKRLRAAFGHSSGHVSLWGFPGTLTFNGATITPRIRTQAYSLPTMSDVLGVRQIDLWTGTQAATMTVKYAADAATTFTAHGQSPLSLSASGKSLQLKRLDGKGTTGLIPGRLFQLELSTTSATGLTLHALELGVEDLGRRDV